MPNGPNFAQIIGNLTADPVEQRGGIVTWRMATDEPRLDGNGVRVEHTEYHDCYASGGVGQLVFKRCRKGTELLVQGCLRTEEFTGTDKVKRTKTKVRASWVKLGAGQKRDGDG